MSVTMTVGRKATTQFTASSPLQASPSTDGIEATRLIKSRYPDVAVVGLSMNANAHNETAMLDAGAALLLTKEAAVEQLYAAIREATQKSPDPASSSS